jgi:hypothetical protein
MMKGNQTLVAVDMCSARTLDIKVKILENVYEMLCESIDVWGSEEGWKDSRETL